MSCFDILFIEVVFAQKCLPFSIHFGIGQYFAK